MDSLPFGDLLWMIVINNSVLQSRQLLLPIDLEFLWAPFTLFPFVLEYLLEFDQTFRSFFVH